jgi:hypothetical protein
VTVAQLENKAEGRTGVRAVVKEDVARCGEIREIPKTRTKHKIDQNTSPRWPTLHSGKWREHSDRQKGS